MQKANKGINAQGAKNSKNESAIFSGAMLDKLNALSISEKIKGKKSLLYSFERQNKSKEEEKTLRRKLRNQLSKHCNNIFIYAKGIANGNKEQNALLKAEIDAFNAFYKKNYLGNDYSLNSIYQGKESKEIENYSFMLSIIKEFK